VLIAAIIYGAVTLVLVHNLLPVATTRIYSDLGDPLLNASILEWNARTVPLTHAWWNFPSFAPLSGITAFTEHLLFAYPISTPIIWATDNPILAYNVVFIVALWANAMAACMLGFTLTRSRLSGFVGGLALAFSPFNAVHLSHVQMLYAAGMPLTLAGLHRYVLDGQPSALWFIASGWLLVGLSNAYMLAFFPIFLAVWFAWSIRRERVRHTIFALLALVVVSAPLIPLVHGYAVRHAVYGLQRPYQDVLTFSADIAGSLGIANRALLWRFALPTTFGEGSLFPGATILALAVIAVLNVIAASNRNSPPRGLSAVWSSRLARTGLLAGVIAAVRLWTGPYSWRIGPIRLPPFEPSIVFPLVVAVLIAGAALSPWMERAWRRRDHAIIFAFAALLFWLLALGPEPTIARYRALAYAPYRAFLWLPFTREIRVAARAWQPATVCLAALAALGTNRLLQRFPRRATLIVAAVSAMIIAEGWWSCETVAPPSRVASVPIPNGAMVMDLPISNAIQFEAEAQYRGVVAGYRTVNGYSGYNTVQHIEVVRLTEDLDDRVFDAYRKLNHLFVIVRAQKRREIGAWVASQPGAERVMTTPELDLYRLPAFTERVVPIPVPLSSRYATQSLFP